VGRPRRSTRRGGPGADRRRLTRTRAQCARADSCAVRSRGLVPGALTRRLAGNDNVSGRATTATAQRPSRWSRRIVVTGVPLGASIGWRRLGGNDHGTAWPVEPLGRRFGRQHDAVRNTGRTPARPGPAPDQVSCGPVSWMIPPVVTAPDARWAMTKPAWIRPLIVASERPVLSSRFGRNPGRRIPAPVARNRYHEGDRPSVETCASIR
jgi:hypothetical protein